MQVAHRQFVQVAVVLLDEGPARQIGIDDQFENILPESGIGKIPAIVVGLQIEIEPVFAVDPTDLHGQIELFGVELRSPAAVRIVQLGESDGIAVGHHIPIRELPVDARNRRAGKLEYLVFLFGACKRLSLRESQTHQHRDR